MFGLSWDSGLFSWLGAPGPHCIVRMVCPALHLLEEIKFHPGRKIAWFALILCGHRCWPRFRHKQILLLGPRCLYHRSLYTEVYFVLKLLAFFGLFSKLTLQKWKLPHFYFNLKHPAECLTQLVFHYIFDKWKNESKGPALVCSSSFNKIA